MIQERCGTVAFKRGEMFCNQKKVSFIQYNEEQCEAVVSSGEDFVVTVKKEKEKTFCTTCTCPSLASFQKECQHVAAVLLSIYQKQLLSSAQTEAFMALFQNKRVRSGAHQLYFDDRQLLSVTFILTVIKETEFGIRLKVEDRDVPNIGSFLEDVQKNYCSQLSEAFTYNPNLHCFSQSVYQVIEQLMKMENRHLLSEGTIMLSPSVWEEMLTLLTKAPDVVLDYNQDCYRPVTVKNEKLPISFHVEEKDGNHHELQVKGLNDVTVMKAYNCVLSQGTVYMLKDDDCNRLVELIKMLEVSGNNSIPIVKHQLSFFIEKVIPGLQKIGHVHVSGEHFLKTPLVAKLYLDRVKDRLLASLEFQYEQVVINPLEKHSSSSVLIRDEEKENVILQLMEEGEFTETEGGYYLHNEELEYQFLYDILPKLQKLTQVYATTAVRHRIIRENPKPQIRVKIKKERTNWLEFKFEMTGINNDEIKEVLVALEEKRKYYRLRSGALLSLESRELKEIERFLKAMPMQKEDVESSFAVPLVEGMRLLSHYGQTDSLHLEQSFREFLQKIQHPDQLDYEVPISLVDVLRPYQVEGFKWLKNMAHYQFGGILADDMGLGKTLQCITFLLSELTEIRQKEQPALIVCPSSLTYNWLSEVKKFAPELRAVIIDGTKKERVNKQNNLNDVDLVITSYHLLRQDIRWYEKQAFYAVFFDEAQAFKNPITQTAKAVKKVQANYKFALTGTPVENSIEELWSIFHVVFPELFLGLKEYSLLSSQTIARRIRPFVLRRLKEDVLEELPKKREAMELVELLPEQKKLYGAYLAKLREDTFKHLDKDTFRKNKIRILAGLTRLRQICCHPALFIEGYQGSSAKFQQLLQILKEAQVAGRRVLIFSQFTSMLHIIGRELNQQDVPFFYLDGQTPSEDRVTFCNQFNSGERDVFLISLKAGGTGLNLTGADTVILYDLWWNPAVEEQAMDRAHRMGQKNEVQVIKLVARGTIEEKMNELQEKKRHLIEEIIDPDEKTTATLTEEDIKELLMI